MIATALRFGITGISLKDALSSTLLSDTAVALAIPVSAFFCRR